MRKRLFLPLVLLTCIIGPRIALRAQEVLEKVSALPVSGWSFKDEKSVKHIGPMAQDFYAAFGTGLDDKHIATVDADGVALAAIQGLHQIVKDKEARIFELEKRLAVLEHIMNRSTTGAK